MIFLGVAIGLVLSAWLDHHRHGRRPVPPCRLEPLFGDHEPPDAVTVLGVRPVLYDQEADVDA